MLSGRSAVQGNFLFWIFVEILWFALQLSFIGLLYQHTETIGSWTKWPVLLLVGASHFIQQIFQSFFLINCANLSELVRNGKLDFLLIPPVNTRFVFSLRQVNLGGFANAAFAVVVMIYAARQIPITPGFGQLLGFGAPCLPSPSPCCSSRMSRYQCARKSSTPPARSCCCSAWASCARWRANGSGAHPCAAAGVRVRRRAEHRLGPTQNQQRAELVLGALLAGLLQR